MPLDNKNSLLIVGTGAMACLFAARLAAARVRVIMLGTWNEGLQALNEHGVQLIDPQGQEFSYPIEATDDPNDCAEIPIALVLVKSWQTERAASQLNECLASDGLALSMQNGIGNREKLAKVLGSKRVALGVTTAGATLLGPGRVRQAGEGVISISAHSHLATLSSLFRAAGFVVENAPDASALLWGKLVINAAINPITAILNIPNGELLNRTPARKLLKAAAREAASVAVAQGIQLPYPDPVVTVESIARRTADNRSSMLQDIQRGAPTEIDAICGAIVQAGEQVGVPTPINRTLMQLIKAMRPGDAV